jgi:hypothetical protein
MKQHPADLQPPDEEEDDRAIRHLEEEQAEVPGVACGGGVGC